MRVRINPKQIAPDLLQKINGVAGYGHDLSRYPRVFLDLEYFPTLSDVLLAAAKTPDSGVVMEESTSPTKPKTIAKPTETKPEPLTEGALRLRCHVNVNGLISCENNTLAIRSWFQQHPEAKFDKDTIDKVIFDEIEHELLWEPDHAGHAFWVRKFQPLPPAPVVEPKPKPLPRVPNGEKRLPIPSTEADLRKASVDQIRDYRDRLQGKQI
jgi:hypothetical protein